MLIHEGKYIIVYKEHKLISTHGQSTVEGMPQTAISLTRPNSILWNIVFWGFIIQSSYCCTLPGEYLLQFLDIISDESKSDSL